MSDLISRAEAIEAVRSESAKRLLLGRGDILYILYKLPSANRLRGEWFGDKCSICGTERAWYGDTPNFCPDCGADMREEWRNED